MTRAVSRSKSSGLRTPFSMTCSVVSSAGGAFCCFSCARSCARFSRYSTYARATSCSPPRISASSTWSWISSIWIAPPSGLRFSSAATTASVSRVTSSRTRAELAPWPPLTARNALVMAIVIFAGSNATTAPLRRITLNCAKRGSALLATGLPASPTIRSRGGVAVGECGSGGDAHEVGSWLVPCRLLLVGSVFTGIGAPSGADFPGSGPGKLAPDTPSPCATWRQGGAECDIRVKSTICCVDQRFQYQA